MSGLPPVPEIELTPAPLAQIGEQLSPSPWQYRFTGEDALEIAAWSSQSGTVIAVQGRMWSAEEGIRPFAHTHVPTSDRARSVEIFGLPYGYLLNAVVFASSGSPRLGQTFVSLHVIRGRGQARYLLATLLQGYVTADQELAFPGSPVASSVEGGAYTRVVTGSDPSAGNGVFETVPTGARWRVRAAKVTLATSATAATRRIFIALLDQSANYIAWGWQALTQAASETNDYFWGINQPIEGVPPSNKGVGIVPDVTLIAGMNIQIQALQIQPGDNFGAPLLTVDEWLEAQ